MNKTVGIRAFILCLLSFILITPFSYSQNVAEEDPRWAIGFVNSVCTGQMISPTLLITASHCVGLPQQEVRVVFRNVTTQERRPYTGTVVWDGAYFYSSSGVREDIAIVRLSMEYPHRLRITSELPPRTAQVRVIGFGMGIPHWDRWLRIEGLYDMDGYGRVLIVRGEQLPGASGSLMLYRGVGVAMVTNGTNFLQPPIIFGPIGSRLQEAVADLVESGEMRFCERKEGDRTVRYVCRSPYTP